MSHCPGGLISGTFWGSKTKTGDVTLNRKKRACSAVVALVLLSLSGISAVAGGTYYRWIDASGTPVNSDRPPPAGIEYETIATSTNERMEEIPGEEVEPLGAKPAQDTGSGQEAAGVPRMEIVKNPEACAAARQNLETLNTHARIRIPDGEGSYRFLNEDEKAAERAKAETAIKQNCD
jgi:hypothetical protein